MKKVFLIASLAVAAFSVKAQDETKPLTFSIGAEAALPVGDFIDSDLGKFSDVYSFGAGLSLQGKYALDESLGLTLNLGYINFFAKDDDGYKAPSFGAVPVLGGIEYNFTPQLFASAQLGYTFYTGKMLKEDEEGLGGLVGDDVKLSGFTYAPGIGFRITPNFSAMLKYQGASVKAKANGLSESGNLSHIGLRLAYSF